MAPLLHVWIRVIEDSDAVGAGQLIISRHCSYVVVNYKNLFDETLIGNSFTQRFQQLTQIRHTHTELRCHQFQMIDKHIRNLSK